MLLAILFAITIQCTRVAGRAFPNGKSLGRNRVIGVVIWLEPKMRIRPRFSIKFLLLITVMVALILTAIKVRPSSEIRVTFESNGRITLQGEPINTESLRGTIDRERTWRRLWIQTSNVVVVLPESILEDNDSSFKSLKTNAIGEVISPPPKKSMKIRTDHLTDLLEKHRMSDLENIIIVGIDTVSSNVTNAR